MLVQTKYLDQYWSDLERNAIFLNLLSLDFNELFGLVVCM